MIDIVLLGGGAHCRVVAEALRESGAYSPVAIVDVAEKVGGTVSGIPIVGTESDLPGLREQGISTALVTVGTVGVGDTRARLFCAAKEAGFTLPVIVHPAAWVSPSATLGEGTFVAAGALVGVGAVVGENCILNTGAVVDHDCVIGDHVHIAPGVAISGGSAVGDRSLVGTGASVLQCVTIGAGTVIGAGSAVVSDIGDETVAVGVPCRVVRGA